MDDYRLTPRHLKFADFCWFLFESSDNKRTYNSDVENSFGVWLFLSEKHENEKLINYLDKMNGKFCFKEALAMNAFRFGFQWLDAFAGQIGDPYRFGRAMSLNSMSLFGGGLIQTGALVTAAHYAGNSAHNEKGIGLSKFMFANMFNLVLATPLTAMAEKMLNPRISVPDALFRVVTPSRLAFYASFSLSVGLYNNGDSNVRMLYYPSLLLSGIMLRLAATSPFVLPGLNDPTGLMLETRRQQRLSNFALGTNGNLAVAAFALLNILFPITLTQSTPKRELELNYFEYLRSIDNKL